MVRWFNCAKLVSRHWTLLIILLLVLPNMGNSQTLLTGANVGFKGRYIIAVSDADMIPSAYYDGHLGPVAGADALSVVQLNRPIRALKAVEIGVSNSVTGPPSLLAVTPNGHYAIVAERLGPRPVGKADPLFSDLPLGRALTVVDLSNADQPRVVQRLEGPERANTVSINADGSLVAVSSQPASPDQSSLTLYRFADGRLTGLTLPTVPDWTAGDVMRDARFHPSENTLVLLNATKPALSFVRVSSNGNNTVLTRVGNAVGVDKAPFLAKFTPDGRHVVVNGSYGAGDVLGGGWGQPRGIVATVRFRADSLADGTPQHQYVSHALTGVNPEGLTISPDGQWVVTTNLERSALPLDNPRQGFFSSLTLLRLDARTGLLDRLGDYPFEGRMPESATFDNTSRMLAVTTFMQYDAQQPAGLPGGGSIDFWRLAGDYFDARRIELVKTNYSVPVTRGVHSMVIVR